MGSLKTVLYEIWRLLLIFFMHVETLEVGLFLFLDFFMVLLMVFGFAFGLFGVIVIFFWGELRFVDFLWTGLSKIFVARSGWVFAVLFAFGVKVLGRIFVFEKEVFFAFVLV